MSLGLKHVTLPDGSQVAFRVELSFLRHSAPGLSQQAQPEDSSLPQYDLHAETEIKRVMEGHGHAFAPRRQGQAGVALASQQVSTGKEAR